MKVIFDKLIAVRKTLAAAHQPEHADVKRVLQILREANYQVNRRASAGHANARAEAYLRAGYHNE